LLVAVEPVEQLLRVLLVVVVVVRFKKRLLIAADLIHWQ
jgi:hypothetical protein